ncbi:MAG TPA: ester cyclase [Actinomycetota bacterium]|nr:ester cyclase [Actinomycetota bacterium]
MSAEARAELWGRWIDLWNGNLDVAEQIIHPDFDVHRIPMPHVPEGLGGRDTLVEWVRQTRSIIDGLRLTVEVGPLVDGEMVAGRWFAEGSYRGGIPGATAPAGTRVRFHGNDIWRAEDGLIREYWLSDDLLDLSQQLGVGAPG